MLQYMTSTMGLLCLVCVVHMHEAARAQVLPWHSRKEEKCSQIEMTADNVCFKLGGKK